MTDTSIIKITFMMVVLFISGSVVTKAQKRDDHADHKKRHSVLRLDSFKPAALKYAGKMKMVDHGITEWVSQAMATSNGEELGFVDDYKYEYVYSNDRNTMTVTEYYNEDSEWVFTGWSYEVIFSDQRYILSATSKVVVDDFIETSTEEFFYADNNRIDSVMFRNQISGETEEIVMLYTEYITEDSVHISIYEKDTLIEEGYFANRDNDFIEVLSAEDYTYRITYSDITFDEFVKRLYDDFFFIEVYEEDFINDSWFPVYKTENTLENGKVVQLSDFYYETGDGWVEDYREQYTYEDNRVTLIEEYFRDYDSDSFYSDYRHIISYSSTVSNEEINSNVTEYLLNQNYPNPFNPTTQISFIVPQTGNVQVTVYNVLGRQVAEILNEIKPAGEYKLTFNAQDLPSGIYYYKLTSTGFSETKSMTLIK